jgi:hypothetical protein
MNHIILPSELANQVDEAHRNGISNYLPINTKRYSMDKRYFIESKIGDVSQYIMCDIENADVFVKEDPNIELPIEDI